SGAALKIATIGGVAVVTNAQGFTLYSFAPDTATTSKCNGACAQIWPPVTGPATAGQGVTGRLGTITRSDGSKQATYDGHPLYTAHTPPIPPRARPAPTAPTGTEPCGRKSPRPGRRPPRPRPAVPAGAVMDTTRTSTGVGAAPVGSSGHSGRPGRTLPQAEPTVR